MKKQKTLWTGSFGKSYTDRNISYQTLPFFKEMLTGLQIDSVCELGTNVGNNLRAIKKLYPDSQCLGVDPSRYAIQRGQEIGGNIDMIECMGQHTPFKSDYFDLTISSGVMIHIQRNYIFPFMSELFRLSKKYILIAEYNDDSEVEVNYRGHDKALWRRPYGKMFQNNFDVQLFRQGYFEDWDKTTWWLYLKNTKSN